MSCHWKLLTTKAPQNSVMNVCMKLTVLTHLLRFGSILIQNGTDLEAETSRRRDVGLPVMLHPEIGPAAIAQSPISSSSALSSVLGTPGPGSVRQTIWDS